MNRASIGAISLLGSSICSPVCVAKISAYTRRSRWTVAGSSTLTLTGLSLLRALNLSFAIFSIRLEHEITIHDHSHRKSRTDGERRLDVEITANLNFGTHSVRTAPPPPAPPVARSTAGLLKA